MVARFAGAFLAVVVAVATALSVTAGPAQAGSVSCNSWTPFNVGPGTFNIPTVGFNTGNIQCVLGVGNNSDAVRRLQEALAWCNGQNLGPSGIDGDYGGFTRQAVLNVQRAHPGVSRDGVYGPQTEGIIIWPLHDFGGGISCTQPD